MSQPPVCPLCHEPMTNAEVEAFRHPSAAFMAIVGRVDDGILAHPLCVALKALVVARENVSTLQTRAREAEVPLAQAAAALETLQTESRNGGLTSASPVWSLVAGIKAAPAVRRLVRIGAIAAGGKADPFAAARIHTLAYYDPSAAAEPAPGRQPATLDRSKLN